MKLHFQGAARTVTGSRYQISLREKKVLVDCGLFQGVKNLRLKNWEFEATTFDIDAVILTHAHLDHSGALPLLVKNGFRGPIYATPATRDLCRILLTDSGYLQEEEARFANKHGYSKHRPARPLYTRKDAEESLKYFVPVDFHNVTDIPGVLRFQLFPAGHILGAASARLEWNGKSILFSGDLGRSEDPIMRAPEVPEAADYVVIESTYGNKTHAVADPLVLLGAMINRVLKRGGTIVIPSFAVGRAQLILFLIERLKSLKQIPNVPVFLNSPMADQANEVFQRYAGGHRLSVAEVDRVCSVARVVRTPEESIALNEMREPKIIIAASGMATGGRVLHHLKSFGPDPKNAIVFVGFQAAGTRGEALVRGAAEVKIHGEMWPIRAEVENLDVLSAHADSEELLYWLGSLKTPPRKVFVTHGEPEAAESFKTKIQERLDIEALVPDLSESFDL